MQVSAIWCALHRKQTDLRGMRRPFAPFPPSHLPLRFQSYLVVRLWPLRFPKDCHILLSDYPSRLQFHILSGKSISFPQEGVIAPCHLEFHCHYHSTISVPTISPAKAGILFRKSLQRCSKFPSWWDIGVKMQALCMWHLRFSTKWQLL